LQQEKRISGEATDLKIDADLLCCPGINYLICCLCIFNNRVPRPIFGKVKQSVN
jgi:hypothetical protein